MENIFNKFSESLWARLETLLKEKCNTDPKLKWPVLFKRFIDDGFGVMDGNKLDFEYWVSEFNLLRDSITIDKFKFGNEVDFMDLYIYKGNDFSLFGKLDISVFQKEENKYMYIPKKVDIKNILFVTLFWVNYEGMSEFPRKKSIF